MFSCCCLLSRSCMASFLGKFEFFDVMLYMSFIVRFGVDVDAFLPLRAFLAGDFDFFDVLLSVFFRFVVVF